MCWFLFACVLSKAAMWGGRRGLEASVVSTHLESFEIWFCSLLSQTWYLGYIIDLARIIASSWCYEKNMQHMGSESVKAFGTDPRHTYQCYPHVYVCYICPVEAWPWGHSMRAYMHMDQCKCKTTLKWFSWHSLTVTVCSYVPKFQRHPFMRHFSSEAMQMIINDTDFCFCLLTYILLIGVSMDK